jgi:protocatechuate 4,5-dioxygenase alpha chain
MALEKPYKDIPGTTVFDADMSRKGYHLNQFCMSLLTPENRKRFKSDEAAYLSDWPMTDEQRDAVLARDYNKLILLGGNVYFLSKIFFTDEKSFEWAAANMTGIPQPEYRQTMINGGRSPKGWRVEGSGE